MKLNLGCGYRHIDGFVNIDIRPECKPDLLCDLSINLPYDDGTIEVVRAFDFLEHIEIGKTVSMVEEIWRVLKPGGILAHMTPSTDGRGAFQDPTHRSFWNINSWIYYTDPAHRELIGTVANFKIIEQRDVMTNHELKIVHTFGTLEAVK